MCELCRLINGESSVEIFEIDLKKLEYKILKDAKNDLLGDIADGFEVVGKMLPQKDKADTLIARDPENKEKRVYHKLITSHYDSSIALLKDLLVFLKEEYPDDYAEFIAFTASIRGEEVLRSMGLI